MESPADPYDHPDGVDCIYVQSSVFSNDDVYAVKCVCGGENPCTSECCVCIRTCGISYLDGKLVDEKLANPSSSIFECCEECECRKSCKNKVSQLGPCDKLRIVPLGQKGYGVVAVTLIPKGTFLCEYAGEILSADEIHLRTRPGDTDWRYVITLNEMAADGSVTKTFIDASKFGNVGRYLNHSCDPNSILVPIRYENAAPKVGIFALMDIQKDEECCYLYASADSERSDTPCHCGSDKCSGFLPFGCYTNT